MLNTERPGESHEGNKREAEDVVQVCSGVSSCMGCARDRSGQTRESPAGKAGAVSTSA